MKEIWQAIPGTAEKYQVSNLGRIKNVETGHELSGFFSADGVKVSYKTSDGKIRQRLRRRIVAEVFLPKPANSCITRHHGDNEDDSVENIYWNIPKGRSSKGKKKDVPWTGYEVNILKSYIQFGYRQCDIAGRYLSRNKNSIAGKVYRLRRSTCNT